MNVHSHMRRSPSRLMWIDEIPEEWDQIRGKRIFRQVRTPKKPGDEQLSATQKYGVVPQNQFMEQEGNRVVLALSGTENFRHVDKDDFVISLRSFQGGIERCHYDGCVSPAYTILKKNRDISEDYFGYLLKCDWFISALQVGITGIREGKNVSYEEFGDIILPFPAVQEQTAIARFLDRETGRIDGLIEKKTRFIALLKEKRAAVITHAVTKGIDPLCELSSTGIYWAPSIPSHWRISPFRQACWFQEGPGIMAVDFHDTGVPLLRISGVQGRYASLDGCNFLDPEKVARKWRHFRLHEGDLLISASATMGTITEVGEEAVGAVAYTGIIRMKPSDQVTKRFLSYFLGSSIFMEQINLMKQGSTIQHFGPTHLSNVKIPLPPTNEQEAVAADLDRRTSRIDSLIALTERSIDLLREKRAALITAAVTGKIDVRLAS